MPEKDRPSDFGAFIHRVAMKLQTKGQREKLGGKRSCPADRHQFNMTFSPLACEYKLECKKHLAEGRPVVVWTIFPSIFFPHGQMEVRKLSSAEYSNAKTTWNDSHAMVLVGFNDDEAAEEGGYFHVLNSHGAKFGDRGVGRMTYQYFREFTKDVWYPTGADRIDLQVDFFDGRKVLKH